jgi:uncharacterized protein (DUF362 family)/Pyruvate/2-oxoacid:ferredoxin oxidoreductase delta subunit
MSNVVAFVRCEDYASGLPAALDRLWALSDWPRSADWRGKRVLLKPNLLTDRLPEQAVTTHPEVVRHVIRRFKSLGASVSVGDSPASAANLRRVWQATGVEAVCNEEAVPLLAFEQAGARTFDVAGFSFSLAAPVLEADLVVNLPKVKSHSLTMLTAAVKNLYGAIPGYAKTTLHRLYPKPAVFGTLVKTLWEVLPPTWTLADAVVGMEGQGPANGRPVKLGFLAASADPFALDRALCETLRIDARRVPYLAAQAASGGDTSFTRVGDAVSAGSFEVPSGAHLLGLLPAWLVRGASGLVWVRPAFSAEACVRCGLCVKACPVSALALAPESRRPAFDAARCISCSCCHEVCPHDAVRMTQSPLLRALKVFKGIE